MSFSFVSLVAASERTVQVTFAAAALVGTVLTPGAALNLMTWTLEPTGGAPLTLLASRDIHGDGLTFEIYSLQKFSSYSGRLTLLFPNILSASGGPLIGTATATCGGARVPSSSPVAQPADPPDIANFPVPGSGFGGVIQTTPGGDYALQRGDGLLYKMILRRIVTRPGEFAHLPRDTFGLGVGDKQLLDYSDITVYQQNLLRQVQLEPDVASAQVSVTLNRDGVLNVTVAAVRRSTGQPVTVSAAVPQNAVVF